MDKVEVARRNLGAATELFLRDADPVAVHALAATAGEVLDEWARRESREPFSSMLLRVDDTLTAIELKTARNEIWNAMKHVSRRDGRVRQDEVLLADFTDVANDWPLMTAWYDYAEITGAMPIAAQALQAWVIALTGHSHGHDWSRIGLHNITAMDRKRQKEQLRRVIAKVSKNDRFMSDPKTESRTLTCRLVY